MINPAEGGDFHLAKTGDFGVAVDSCGSSFNLACAHVFITAMGAVMRCGHCQAVLGVIVRGFRETLVNLSGLDYIRVPHL